MNDLLAGTTEGPWFVNPARAWIEVPDRDAPICALLWPTELRSEDETFANGRLIAQAPSLATENTALRSLCAELVDALDEYVATDSDISLTTENRAFAALAHAKELLP